MFNDKLVSPEIAKRHAESKARYARELRVFLKGQFAWYCVAGLGVSLAMSYGLFTNHAVWFGSPESRPFWPIAGLVIGLIALIPIYVVFRPEPPRLEDAVLDDCIKKYIRDEEPPRL